MLCARAFVWHADVAQAHALRENVARQSAQLRAKDEALAQAGADLDTQREQVAHMSEAVERLRHQMLSCAWRAHYMCCAACGAAACAHALGPRTYAMQ